MKCLIDRLHRVYRLPRGERAILGQAWGFFLLAELALRILPFPRLLTLSDRVFLKSRGAPAEAAVPSFSRLVWLVEVAARYAPVSATCLKKALVLSWLLRRRGIATTLRLGVVRRDAGLQAHAWIEREGRVILGLPGSDGYEPIFTHGMTTRDNR